MFKPVEVKACPNYMLLLRYADGTEGEVDLSDFVGKGVFKLWDDYRNFERVKIGEHGAIEFFGEIDLCGDALYLRLTGKAPDDIFPNLKEKSFHT